jgi:hypothetical protein
VTSAVALHLAVGLVRTGADPEVKRQLTALAQRAITVQMNAWLPDEDPIALPDAALTPRTSWGRGPGGSACPRARAGSPSTSV